eukprot:9503873-Pyramimonas_sp.AAC.1
MEEDAEELKEQQLAEDEAIQACTHAKESLPGDLYSTFPHALPERRVLVHVHPSPACLPLPPPFRRPTYCLGEHPSRGTP